MKTFVTRITLLLVIVFCSQSVHGDVLYLKNGSELEGIVSGETDNDFIVDVEIGQVIVPKEDVESLRRGSESENFGIQIEWKEKREHKKLQAAKSRRKRFEKEELEKRIAEEKEKKKDFETEMPIDYFLEPFAPKLTTDIEGVEIRHFVADHDDRFSYTAVLPENFERKENMPVLFVFDPGYQGEEAAWRFAFAAKKYGWIIAGSHESGSHAPLETNLMIQDAMIKDIKRRFDVSGNRFYAAGFARGGRMAMIMAIRYSRNFRGVIAAGADAFHFPKSGYKPKQRISVYSLCGKYDKERLPYMKEAHRQFLRHGIRSKLFIYDGGNEWPSKSDLKKAVRWIVKQTR